LAAGARGEGAAVLFLRLKGYRILARNYLVKGGEIDIIAQKGETLAFVEVKWRAALDDAFLAIDAAKRRRIVRAARVFISRRGVDGLTLRGDAIYLAPWRWPHHVAGGFELALD
jgi:putative endonuclease